MTAAPPPISFAHLDALSKPIVVDGTPMLATMIYAEAPGYVPIGDPDEGIACVDDVARAAVAWLDEHERTGDPHALRQARGALEFTLRMQEPDGTFVNFITDEAGTMNRTGETSRPELGWWTFRGMWAVARGHRAFEQSDPAFAERLARSFDRSEGALADALAQDVGRTTTSRGREVPAFLERFSPDAISVAAIALAEKQQERPAPRTRAMLETIAEGIAASRVRAGIDGAFDHAAHTIAEPELWHAWGAHQGEALARAGDLLDRPDLVEAARAEVEGMLAWQLAAGRVHELRPGPLREGQQAYGVTMAVRGAMALHRATDDDRYAAIAGLHASWYAGNNMAREPMYDPATGRGYDGIDAPPRGVNRSSGAESTIEAIMALQAIRGNATAERMAQLTPTSEPTTWTSTPVDATLEPGARTTVEVTVDAPGEYVLLGATSRPADGTAATAATVDIAIGDRPVARLPGREGTGQAHAALDRAQGAPFHLEAGTHQVTLEASGPDSAAPVQLSQLVLHPAVARTSLTGPDGPVEVSWSMDEGRLHIEPGSG